MVSTGIYKEPVSGPVMMRTWNLDGDRQADLRVHGGVDKAVYGYAVEDYDFWREEFPKMNLPPGMFGENLTIEGLREEEVFVGDRFRVGAAEIMAVQPRVPCYKLGIKFGRPDILKRFMESRRTGIYFRVLGEGLVESGQEIEPLGGEQKAVSVADITRLYAFEKTDRSGLKAALQVRALPEGWMNHFQRQLESISA